MSKKADKKLQEAIQKEMDTLDKIIEILRNGTAIDDESIAYYPEKYQFSRQDFTNVFDTLSIAHEPEVYTDMFEEGRLYFEYKGVKFIWRTMSGQGTISQLIPESGWSNNWPSEEFPMLFNEKKEDYNMTQLNKDIFLTIKKHQLSKKALSCPNNHLPMKPIEIGEKILLACPECDFKQNYAEIEFKFAKKTFNTLIQDVI